MIPLDKIGVTLFIGGKLVSMYPLTNDTATAAMEQVCDERRLVPRLLRPLTKKWIVTLSKVGPFSDEELVRVEDDSLALAICKALAELT